MSTTRSIDLDHYSWKERVVTPDGERLLTPHSDPMEYECPVDYIYEDVDRAVAHRDEMAEVYDDAAEWVLVHYVGTPVTLTA